MEGRILPNQSQHLNPVSCFKIFISAKTSRLFSTVRYFLIASFFIAAVFSAQAATLSFLVVHPGDGTSYTKSSSTITWTTTLSGTSFLFTSANPADVTFSGNDVAGQFSYISNGMTYKINGVISRPQKTGNTVNGFYFYESTVLGGNVATGRAWLFQVPGRTVDASPSKTSSDPVGSDMETIRLAQAADALPVITSDGGGLNAYITIPENTTAVTTVTATVYSGSTKTFSISGGVDASKFTINSSTGALTFVSAPDYENPTDAGLNNIYDVQVTVTDSQGATDVQNIAVTITNVNDNPPVITSDGGGATATIGVVQGTTAVTTVTATDADYGDVLTYSITGGANSSLFSINPSSGALTFKSAAVDGTYTVIVTVTDGAGHTDTQTLTVNVTTTDTTPPSVVITSSDNLLAAGESCTVYFKFSEQVQGFTQSDVSLPNGGTLGTITQSLTDPTLYYATYTQVGSASQAVFNIAAASYQDLAGNNGTSGTLSIPTDLIAPTVSVAFTSTDISYGETDLVTFTFSEAPGSSFTMSDITVTNASISNLVVSADPKVWTASVQQTSAVSAPVVTVQDKSYTDAAGNAGSSGTATIPVVPPTIDLANTPTSDTGISYTDNITSNRKPVVTGLVDTGTSTVTVQVEYYVSGTLTTLTYNNVAVNGTTHIYSLDLSAVTPSTGTMPSAGLPEGYVTLVVTTPSSATASSEFLIDLTAPAVPTVNTLTTYDQTPAITGTATLLDNEVLTVQVNGVTYTNGDGHLTLNGTTWTLNVPSANRIPAGTYNVIAKITDLAGNSSTDVTTNELTINPSNVTIDLANNSTDDTGTSSTDNITSNRAPVVNGTATGGDTSVKVTVVSGGVTYTYNSVAVSGGAYSLNLATTTPSSVIPTGSFPASGLPSGTVNLTVEGNSSGAIGTNSFVIDYTAPATPTVTSQSTWNTKPTITGTGTFSTGDILKVTINGITYTSGDGNLSYNAGAGTWSLTIPSGNALSVGTAYPTTATITDAAGNVSPTGSGTTTITLPTVTGDLANTSASDTGTSNTDNLTSNRKPVITGTASDDVVVTVTITSGGTTYTYNNVTVTSGNWSLDLSTASTTSGSAFPASGLASGTATIGVTGNTTSATGSNTFVVDFTAPTTPTVVSQSTWNPTPTISGTAVVGAGDILKVTINSVTYTSGDGNLSYNSGNNTWSLVIPAGNALAVNAYPTTVAVTDAAGNTATGNGTTTITQPTVTGDLANTSYSDTGTSSTDNITSNRKPIITGTASDDAVVTVTITSGGTTYTYNNVTVTAGNWSLDLSTASTTSGAAFPAAGLSSGTADIGVTGNTTGASGSNSFTVDFTAPTIPTVNYLSTYDTTPTITGTATVNAGDVFTVTVHGVTYTNGDGNLSYSSGTWTLTIPQGNELPVNTYTVVATVTDPAGNSSSNSTTNQLVINQMPADVQTYNIIATPTFTTADISWSNGSKTSRIVFVKDGTGAISNPVDGTTYTASSDWNLKGTQLGSSGYYCVYKGSDVNGSVDLINLYPGHTYTIQAFEYSGTTGSEVYLTSISGTNNPQTVIPWPTTTFTNSQGVSSAEAWNKVTCWDHNVVPDASLHEAVKIYIDGNCQLLNSQQCYNLTIKAPHDGITPVLTINPNKLLNILGGSLNGELTNLGGVNALVIKANQALANGSVIFHNTASNPVLASVEMYSKAFTDTKFHWQYFGIPVKTQTVGTTFAGYPERVRKYDESNKDPYNVGLWNPAGSTTTLSSSTVLVPVDGYEVTQPSAKTYVFKGELLNQDISRTLQYTPGANYAGQNILANPYACAIDITQMTFGSETEAAVYQYNAGSLAEWSSNGGGSAPGSNPGTYIVSTKNSAGILGVPGEIPSMQGFLVNALSNSPNATFGISYNSLVLNSSMQRTKATTSDKVCTSIQVYGAHNSDVVWLFTDPTCTRSYDNGWDGRKYMGTTTMIYASEQDGDYMIDAVDDVNNTYLGFQPGSVDSSFKLVFNHQNLATKYSRLFLNDLVTGALVDVTADNSEYTFTAAAGSTAAKRFKVVTLTGQVTGFNGTQKSPLLTAYNFGNSIFVSNLTGNAGKMMIYNTIGGLVSEFELSADRQSSVKTALVPGLYIARMVVGTEETTISLIIH